MVRSRQGWWLVACLLIGCGESARPTHAASEQSGGAGGAGSESAAAAGAAGSEPAATAGSNSDSTAGSGNQGELAAYFEPGSRLKPKVLAADDGLDIIDGPLDAGWYDSELDFDCFFLADAAGVERCFPLQLVGGLMYADANCSRPVVATGAVGGCGGLRYEYLIENRAGCDFQAYRVTDELPASTPLFISADGESCQPSSSSAELAPFYELEAVPAESFVGMKRGARARAPGLDAYVREGDDGSWQIIGHFDQTRQASCFGPRSIFNPHLECLPAFATGIRFADSTCETRAAETAQGSCDVEPPTAILQATLDGSVCQVQYDLEFYEIDSIREATLHEVDGTGACVQSAGQPTEAYIQGRSLDLATLPSLETHVVGSGSVRALFSGFGDVPYLPIWNGGPSLVDTAGAACHPFDFPDGSVRCVPADFATTAPAAFAYEDDACSGEPLVPWFPTSPCLPDAPLPGGVIFPDRTTKCLQRLTATEVLSVTGKSDGGTFYTKTSAGGCQVIAATSPAPTYLRLGDAIAPKDLPQLQRTVRN